MGSIAVSARAQSGMREVQTLYGRHGFVALTTAIDFHLLAVAAYFLSALLSGPEQPVEVPGVRGIRIDPSPNVPTAGAPKPRGPRLPTRTPGHLWRAVITIPLPVMIEDSTIAPDAGIQVSPAADPGNGGNVGENTSSGGVESTSTGSATFGADQPAPIFDFVEKPPVPVKIVTPEYPDIARRMALEGVVLVKALVEKDGRVSKATVTKSTNDMFNERSVEAALRWVFVPGMMNSGAVRVWTAIPFRFSLVK